MIFANPYPEMVACLNLRTPDDFNRASFLDLVCVFVSDCRRIHEDKCVQTNTAAQKKVDAFSTCDIFRHEQRNSIHSCVWEHIRYSLSVKLGPSLSAIDAKTMHGISRDFEHPRKNRIVFEFCVSPIF